MQDDCIAFTIVDQRDLPCMGILQKLRKAFAGYAVGACQKHGVDPEESTILFSLRAQVLHAGSTELVLPIRRAGP